jgi:hypothetical protein
LFAKLSQHSGAQKTAKKKKGKQRMVSDFSYINYIAKICASDVLHKIPLQKPWLLTCKLEKLSWVLSASRHYSVKLNPSAVISSISEIVSEASHPCSFLTQIAVTKTFLHE